MKVDIRIVAAVAILIFGGIGAYIFFPASAQRTANTRFDYAVINGSYLPYPADNVSAAGAAVNICYMSAAGCQNEEVRAEVVVTKFLQDERLENNARARRLVQDRAFQNAFSRAISKLGSDGWEIVEAPSIEFDLYYTDQQGVQTVKEGAKTERQHIWFRRQR